MREKRTADCGLLLILFVIGALAGTRYRERAADFLLWIPGKRFGCLVLILAMDACMTGSLLCRFGFTISTFILGAAAANEAAEILTIGLIDARRRLLVLVLTAQLHFLLGVWSIRAEERIRGFLRARRHVGRIYFISFLLMSFAGLVCACLIYLRIQAKI